MLTITLSDRAEAVVRHKAFIHKKHVDAIVNALLLDYEPSTPEERGELAKRRLLARIQFEQSHVDHPPTLDQVWNNGFAHGFTMFQTRKFENLYFDVERPAETPGVK